MPVMVELSALSLAADSSPSASATVKYILVPRILLYMSGIGCLLLSAISARTGLAS